MDTFLIYIVLLNRKMSHFCEIWRSGNRLQSFFSNLVVIHRQLDNLSEEFTSTQSYSSHLSQPIVIKVQFLHVSQIWSFCQVHNSLISDCIAWEIEFLQVSQGIDLDVLTAFSFKGVITDWNSPKLLQVTLESQCLSSLLLDLIRV